MVEVTENLEVFLRIYSELAKAGKVPEWLERIRADAIESFAGLGFPTTHHEEWKYTNVARIADTAFEPAKYPYNKSIAQQMQRSPFADLDCPRLVFLNGSFCPELSSPPAHAAGVKAASLAGALSNRTVEEHLARYADFAANPFVALNTAFIQDGAFVEIPKGLVLEKPIYLLFVSAPNGRPAVTHPRSLLVVGRESQVSFIEGHLSLGQSVYLTNAVTEIVADENAHIAYTKVQQESDSAFHVSTVKLHQARNSSASTTSIALGGRLVREEIIAVLDGEGGVALLNGIYVTTGEQHVDNHTTIDHAKPHCSSREFYKGVLDGKSTGVFNGKIIVRKDAQKTDSKQSNKNLLLSEDAVINTKPQLEIYADDVKCTHGATVGQIDPEAVFYLRSRGVGLEEARNMLVVAFVNDILDRIKFEPLRACLKSAVSARLALERAGVGSGESGATSRKREIRIEEASR